MAALASHDSSPRLIGRLQSIKRTDVLQSIWESFQDVVQLKSLVMPNYFFLLIK